jgi:hypothetical protein
MKLQPASKKGSDYAGWGSFIRWTWLALFTLLGGVSGRAADTIQLAATVAELTGKARCMITNSWQPLRKGTALSIGSVVQTAGGSELEIKLTGRDVQGLATIHLGPDSLIELVGLGSSGTGPLGTRDVSLAVRIGTSRTTVSGDAEWGFEVRTSHGTACRLRRRGGPSSPITDFTVSSAEVVVHGGELGVSQGGAAERLLRAGERLSLGGPLKGPESGEKDSDSAK